MKTKLLLISLLCIGLLSCEKDNQRENESSNNQENVNGSSNESSNNQENVNGSSDENDSSYIKNGALPGVFSVSDTKQVKFSQGNLQYQASTNTWRFAEHQYDVVGMGYGLTDEDNRCYVGGIIPNSDNREISSTYSGWIDLFGWGTGDNPTNASESNEDYPTFVDWGVNKISNGGNVSNAWFTLSNDEWYYLLRDRTNAEEKRGVACVNGISGLVLLPDDWTLPGGAHFTSGLASNDGYEYYKTVNTYTASEWTLMESAGAVFLPAAGYRDGASVNTVGAYGYFWSSTYISSDYAYYMGFGLGGFNPSDSNNRFTGRIVRLVQDVE